MSMADVFGFIVAHSLKFNRQPNGVDFFLNFLHVRLMTIVSWWIIFIVCFCSCRFCSAVSFIYRLVNETWKSRVNKNFLSFSQYIIANVRKALDKSFNKTTENNDALICVWDFCHRQTLVIFHQRIFRISMARKSWFLLSLAIQSHWRWVSDAFRARNSSKR